MLHDHRKIILNKVSARKFFFYFFFFIISIKTMSSKFWIELSKDYEKLFETEIGYDVIIYVGEDQNVKEIHAHSNILCARSQYFRSALSNEWVDKRDGKIILENLILNQNYLILFLGIYHITFIKKKKI
jgi:hypothetical protein